MPQKTDFFKIEKEGKKDFFNGKAPPEHSGRAYLLG